MTRAKTNKNQSKATSHPTTKNMKLKTKQLSKSATKPKKITSSSPVSRSAPQSKKSTKPRHLTESRVANQQSTSTFFLKLVLYIILGSFWLRFSSPVNLGLFELRALPVGLFIGLLFIRFEMSLIDRKIQLAVLLIVTVMSLFLNTGIII